MIANVLFHNPPEGELGSLMEAFQVEAEDCRVHAVEDEGALLRALATEDAQDLVFIDVTSENAGRRGMDLLATARRVNPDVPIVAVAPHGNVEIASRAIEMGATDFLVRKGELGERVHALLRKLEPLLSLREENLRLRESSARDFAMIGNSPRMRTLLENVRRVAPIPRPVLITGERGTGKELIAQAVHQHSPRARLPLITVNCAAFSDTLLESELFGHERGAFTGAVGMKRGKFELAHRGTLFLDEIANMSLPFQTKILRAVEYGSFLRVGGEREIQVDVRVIAATNTDLNEAAREGKFLPDLLDRLTFEELHLPPLRERREDVPLLADYFFKQFLKEIPGFRNKRLAPSALNRLSHYNFPGNVRELKHIIERAIYRDRTSEITAEDIGIIAGRNGEALGASHNFTDRVENYKRALILTALEEANNNQRAAARALELSYHQFRYFLGKYREGVGVE